MTESTPRRSHNGCWTCKARRRKCDRTRPTCQACDQRGLACEGYEVRLRWGSGIASRGRFTGAPEPVISSIPPRPKGRRRDWSRERQHRLSTEFITTHHDDTEGCPPCIPRVLPAMPLRKVNTCRTVPFSSGSPSLSTQSQAPREMSEDEKLFQEFCSTGVNMLHSTSVHDAASFLGPQLPILCQQSEALYRICLTLQISITPSAKDRFFEYFDAALNQFRAELAGSVTNLEDGTFTAGLLLCSIGVSYCSSRDIEFRGVEPGLKFYQLVHGMPWTMHLQGMYNILQMHGLGHCSAQTTPFRAHLLEVMGVMDLPTFTIGRKSPCLGVWRLHCRDRISNDIASDYDGVEVVSGIPRSLLDLFSYVDDGVTEEEFWDWPGAQGNLLQHQLWEAYRLAGILTVRHRHLFLPDAHAMNSVQPRDGRRHGLPRKLVLPSTEVIVPRILSNVDAIRRASAELEGKGSLILNAINYPVFIAGLQAHMINNNPELKQVIQTVYNYGDVQRLGYAEQLLYKLLEEWWECYRNTSSIHHLAEAKGIELGLF